jgi:hypothetical protein
MINIHNSDSITPEVHRGEDGRGWLTLRVKRKGWYSGNDMEEVEVTMFSEDISKLSCDLSEQLRESIAQSLEATG